jgi:hypothetical protein
MKGGKNFVQWLNSLDTSSYDLWIIMGDFHMIRSNEDRNRPGGNSSNMLLFNSMIQLHDLEEIPLKGIRSYTWSNLQDTPLLEKSAEWTSTFPNILASPMARLGSDHIPIRIQIGSDIPKSNIFRFEEYWLEFDGFKEIVKTHLNHTSHFKNIAQDIVAKFKSLRHGIKKWSEYLTQLSYTINKCSYVLALLDGLEEQRALSWVEKIFRKALKSHLTKILAAKRLYWRKRANIRWAKLGNENAKLCHAIATRNYRHNHIVMNL